jgi:hypothetical protein
MSFQTFVTERLKAITEALNAIGTNAKKIDELPVQSTLDPASKIHVSKGGTSESLSVQKIIDSIVNKTYSQLLDVGDITVSGLDVIVPSNAMWVYAGIFYQTTTDTIIPETLCATGFLRKDILVANQLNQIVLMKGAESETIRIRPNTPTGTIFVTEMDIDDTTIGTPSLPIIGDAFVTKLEKANGIYINSGSLDNLEINNTRSCLKFQGSITELKSISFPGTNGIPYNGKEFIIENNQSIPFDIFHNSGAGGFRFNFPNAENFTLEPNFRIKFRTSQSTYVTGTFDYIGILPVDISGKLDKATYTGTADDLKTEIDTKLDTSAYNQHFKGVYLTEAALNAAHPTGVAGDSAQVNEVGATDVVNYSWDTEESRWVNNGTGGSGAVNTDALPEGSTNLYFTVARFLTNLTFANIVAALGYTPSTAPNNAQKNSDITKAEIEAKLTGEITSHTHPVTVLPVTETGTSFSLTDAHNGKITILTASCTVTIPNGLMAGFEHTIALGGSVTLFNNSGTTMAEKLSCTIKNRTATNNYITAGSL